MALELKKPSLGYLTILRDIARDDLGEGLEALTGNVNFAADNGFKLLEVACFPQKMGTTVRDFYGETLNVDWIIANPEKAAEGTKRLEEQKGVSIDALCYCANTLGNPLDLEHVNKVGEAATIVGAKHVVTFVGNVWKEIAAIESARGKSSSPEDKQAYFDHAVERRIKPLVDKYAQKGVQFGFENCPMPNDLDKGNPGTSTNLISNRAEISHFLERVPNARLWFDPSHFRNYRPDGEGPSATDYIIGLIKDFAQYIVGYHLKDGRDVDGAGQKYGRLGNAFSGNPHTLDMWEAKIPFEGQIDWEAFETAAQEYTPNAKVRSYEAEDMKIQGREMNEEAAKRFAKKYNALIPKVQTAKTR